MKSLEGHGMSAKVGTKALHFNGLQGAHALCY